MAAGPHGNNIYLKEIVMKYLLQSTALLLVVSGLSGRAYCDDAEKLVLSDQVRERCLKILRDGMRGEEFWPSIHAAEGLTLGGHGEEVIRFRRRSWPQKKTINSVAESPANWSARVTKPKPTSC